MNKRVRIGHVLCTGLFATALGGAAAAPAVAAAVDYVAQAPSAISDRVTDSADVLSDAEESEITEKITQLQQEEQLMIHVVFTTDMDGMSAEEYAGALVDEKGPNSAAYVVNTEQGQMGVQTGDQWPQGKLDEMYDAAYGPLATDDWAGSANALVDAALGSGSASGSGASGAWLAGAGGAVAVAGGGIWMYTRKRSKKESAAVLEDAREIEPTDIRRLNSLDLETLDALAHEELVSTDESIRRGKEELDIAMAEFGPERTRSFTRAMNQSTTTLQKAFGIRQRLDDSIPESPEQRREMLVEIISSCGQADDALDSQAAEFAEMRNLLINASSKLDELTQRTIDVRARLPKAEETLAALRAEFNEEMLQSVDDNVQIASASLDEAEKSLSAAREIEARPAGQQGGLVAHIRDAEHALEVSDRNLAGVENARTNISEAKAGLPALIEEVEGEIQEAGQIKQQGRSQGTDADWAALDEVVARAQQAVDAAKAEGSMDPLGQHTALITIDTELDEQLDTVREQTSTHARQLEMFAKQIQSAGTQIQAAEDVISSRGRIVGSGARTALADAKHLHAQALNSRDRDIRAALDYARQSTNAAKIAADRARDDYNNYRRQQQRRQASNVAGNVITGMVIGQVLGGGGRSGGGGFGGGFGGGGFGGGGGGGFRGGSF
ncbi:MAG: TPM domain-containing protein [Corynebacterium casei]|uniref:TPM domain-containing protein n=1 Tax=Corynebacterium casei TaxID=160386 RepID=UPI002648E5A9|nr:TPM domain-containing protein [Corynebacterium casei]MDN5800438.1 TPM domain-containing protein [Corynebacterium casei]MDN5922932.1 TPM domain-containing protein [Corynebacterium casei]MDN6341813.1 TPM domain-containing protein [Corynebacterium casei]MDN6361289.1 TPM domain-containing protein [Corynebacterium casei]MDN6371064.1 TPM domain-containing protein [Corynebacterium casei]